MNKYGFDLTALDHEELASLAAAVRTARAVADPPQVTNPHLAGLYLCPRYDNLDYSEELNPPLTPEETAWAKSLLKTAGGT